MTKVLIDHEKAKELVVERLTEVGLKHHHAMKVAEVLVHADLRNVNSHGVLRTEHYVNRIKAGGINIDANITFEKSGVVTGEIGRASCRERVKIDVGGDFITKNKRRKHTRRRRYSDRRTELT